MRRVHLTGKLGNGVTVSKFPHSMFETSEAAVLLRDFLRGKSKFELLAFSASFSTLGFQTLVYRWRQL